MIHNWGGVETPGTGLCKIPLAACLDPSADLAVISMLPLVTSVSQLLLQEAAIPSLRPNVSRIMFYHQLLTLSHIRGKESACQRSRYGFDPRAEKTPWRRKRQPTSIFLPGKSHGQTGLMGYSPWGHKRVGRDLATTITRTCISDFSTGFFPFT